MATSSREARRRKIMERGSDRLALITGRLQTLPSSSSPSPDLLPLDTPSRLAHPTSVSPDGEDRTSSSVLLEDNDSTDTGPTKADFGGSTLVPPLSTSETNLEAIQSLASEGELRSPLVSSTDRNSSLSNLVTERRADSQTQIYKIFGPGQISSAIAATETTRLFCSIAVALLVVLSHLGFPILGSKIINSILSFRPLYLVLLTTVTVVLAQLLDKQRSLGADRGGNKTPSAGGNDWAEQLGKTLEIGLLIQKVADAVFMDCAVYAIIVVCGLSLAQMLR